MENTVEMWSGTGHGYMAIDSWHDSYNKGGDARNEAQGVSGSGSG